MRIPIAHLRDHTLCKARRCFGRTFAVGRYDAIQFCAAKLETIAAKVVTRTEAAETQSDWEELLGYREAETETQPDQHADTGGRAQLVWLRRNLRET